MFSYLETNLNDSYSIVKDETIGADSQGKIDADLVVKNNTQGVLFLIEVKKSIQEIDRRTQDNARRLLHIARASSIYITDGEDGFIYQFIIDNKKSDSGKYKWEKKKISDFLKTIEKSKDKDTISFDEVWDFIKQNLPPKYQTISFTSSKIEYANNFVSFDEETEDSFFQQLITIATQFDKTSKIRDDGYGKISLPTILRYTSFSSFTRNFLEKNESMSSVVSMNDRGECFFLDQRLDGAANVRLSDMNPQEIDELNKSFIVSCCEKRDEDLTMWRLYGDDGKGVRLKYEYDPDSISKSNFYLLPVVYDNKAKELINALGKIFRMRRIKGRYKFVFNRLSVWKYFFKAGDYSVEEEVRLLYKYDDKAKKDDINIKWIKNDSYNIVHPIVIFKNLKDFPLNLKKITLGPKCAEIDSNLAQLQQFIREYRKGEEIEVKPSTIKNYR